MTEAMSFAIYILCHFLIGSLPGALLGGIIVTMRNGFIGGIAGFILGGMFGGALYYVAYLLTELLLLPYLSRWYFDILMCPNYITTFPLCLCASIIGGFFGGRAGVIILDMVSKPRKTS